MELLLALINLAGAVALLLWGIRMVQTGVQRAFGARLRNFLSHALKGSFKPLLAGIGVTAILQSSTATGLMVTGFVASGLVDLVPALAVMLGANLGTTLIVQALSFNVVAASPVLVLAGFVVFQRASEGFRDFGRAMIGLGLMLAALHQFSVLLAPYQDMPNIRLFLDAIASQPVLDVILAAGLAAAAHSSVAVVLLVMSFAVQGIVPPSAAFALVLGANIGTAINPVFEGATSDDPAEKRLPLGNLLNRVIGVMLAFLVLPYLTPFLASLESDKARAVADFHTLFNLALALLFLPLLSPYGAFLKRLLPVRISPADPSRPVYLDPATRDIASVALGNAAREALRLPDIVEAMLQGFRDALDKPERRLISENKRLDDILDKLNLAIKAYLVSLDTESLDDSDHRRVIEILAFATQMEQAGDAIDRNLLASASKGLKRGLMLQKQDKAALVMLTDRVMANVRQAASLLMTEDLRAARILANEKEMFRNHTAAATFEHYSRLRAGEIEATETSALFLDLLRDLKIVNSHLVAAAAYPVLERNSELLRSRLRSG